MNQTAQRILTTHTGSLPRPVEVQRVLAAHERGEKRDQEAFENQTRTAVRAVVQQQHSYGIDVVNDGEMSKFGYSTYARQRLTGFEDSASTPLPLADLADYPTYTQRLLGAGDSATTVQVPACTGAITYTGLAAVQQDCAHLAEALRHIRPSPTDAFLTAASPGVIALFLENHYYPSHETYLMALANAMKEEYDAISQAGFLLQVDCPDLAMGRHARFAAMSLEEFQRTIRLHVEVLNHALRDIPANRLRMHLCWGNYEGPHHRDVPLHDIVEIVLQARPRTLSFEAANPRHAHEWRVFETVKVPEDKVLIPGVIDTTTNFIEHPELVAERIQRIASVVGRERVMAGTDCGFASIEGTQPVDPQIAWAKLQALTGGARLASQRLW